MNIFHTSLARSAPVFTFHCLTFFIFAAASDKSADKHKSENGGLMGALLGGTIRKGLGLTAGDFAEFNLSRVRIVNARMAAPSLGEVGGNADSTFLQVDQILVEYNAWDVLNKHVLQHVLIDHPRVWMSELTRKIDALEKGSASAPAQPHKDSTNKKDDIKLQIHKLEIKNVTLYLDNLKAKGMNIPLNFAQNEPLVLEDLSIGDLLHHQGADKLITIAADQVMVHSAYGPMAPLVFVNKITLGFTWKGLANKQIERLIISDPFFYIGEDWFDLVHDLKREPEAIAGGLPSSTPEPQKADAPTNPPLAPTPSFTVKQFNIERLHLALSSFGIVKMKLPFSFNYAASDVELDAQGKFFLSSKLSINERDFALPDYNLDVKGLEGGIDFNWPPKAGKPDNIVPTLKAESLQIKELLATKPWVSLTFTTGQVLSPVAGQNASQAYMGFGSEVYGGYVQGYVLADLQKKWEAHMTGTNINIQAINAFRAQPIKGIFHLKLDAVGQDGNVDTCDFALENANGVIISSHVGGKISEFFTEITQQQSKPLDENSLSDQMKTNTNAMRDRSGEIQTMKNNLLIGEDKTGLLHARIADLDSKYPTGSKLILDENANRMDIYKVMSQVNSKALDRTQKDYAVLWQDRAFPGEWIQTEEQDWHQK